MEKTIFLKNILAEIRRVDAAGNPIAFSIQVRTWNKQNKMGGKLLVYENVILCAAQPKKKVANWKKILQTPTVEKTRKNPNHFQHYTRNIELSTGEVKKINILLITMFNGLEVVY